MPYKKYNSSNNAFAAFNLPIADTDVTCVLKWKFWRFPTSNFIMKATHVENGVVTGRENIYVTTRTGATCTGLIRAYEPVPTDDDATTNIQQALNFNAGDLCEVVISNEVIKDIQDSLFWKLDSNWGLRTWMLNSQNIWATNWSPNITVADTTWWINWAIITWTGIPGGTTILSFVANASAILSANFTGTTWTVSATVGYKQLSEYDATGAEVKRPIMTVSSLLATDLMEWIDPSTRTRKEAPLSVLQADITLASQPIGSVRDTTVLGAFWAWYTLMQTQAMVNTDIFTSRTAIGTARQWSAAWVIWTKMYVVWWDNSTSWAFTTNEEYDFTLNTWSTKAVLPWARSNSYHGVINGKFYIIWGTSDVSVGTSYQVHTYEYDPVGNAWATKASLAVAQWDWASGVYNGKLYIIGGINNAGTTLNTVQYYDPVWNAFTTGLTVIPNARRRCHNHGVTIGSKIYLPGGTDSGGTAQNTMYEYDAVGNSWATKTIIPSAISTWQFEVATVDGEARVISISGFNGSINITNVYEFSPTGNSWANRSTSAPAVRSSAIAAYDNEIYYISGYTSSIVTSHNKYTPYKNRYTYERTS